MRRHGLGAFVTIVAIAVALVAYTFSSGNQPFLGLDLQGGVSVAMETRDEATPEQLELAKSIIEQRVNGLGVAEAEVTSQGQTVFVEIPGIENQDEAIGLVAQTGELRFRPVLAGPLPPPGSEDLSLDDPGLGDPSAGDTTVTVTVPDPAAGPAATDETVPPTSGTDEQGMGVAGELALGAQDVPATDEIDPGTVVAPGELPTGELPTGELPTGELPTGELPTGELPAPQPQSAQITPPDQDLPDQQVTLPQVDPETGEITAVYVLGPSELTGSALSGATAGLAQSGEWIVEPAFKSGQDGIDGFNAVAGKCFAQDPTCPTGALAITLDGTVISAPAIQAASFGANDIQISGSFTEDSARRLAQVLEYGALPVALDVATVSFVSASIGDNALRAGVIAGAIGLGLVALYMIAFYRLLGLVAVAKLVLEGALLWSIISWLGSTQGLALTLAGVTGIIVSIGVSLDSNVVFYEHLKEDVRSGRSMRSAADKSFASAWSTIVKADVASLIAASLLWLLAVGPVRGFAFYLGLSTLLDLIAAWFFMRPLAGALLRSSFAERRPTRLGMPKAGAASRGPAGHGSSATDRTTAGVG